jgi:hypothetical protein
MLATIILPEVSAPAQLVVLEITTKLCWPVTGGVIVASAVVPVINETYVVGAIVAAAV